MTSAYKYPQLYSDCIRFYKHYWQLHNHLPRPFRQSAGVQILHELTLCLKCVAAANAAPKDNAPARRNAVEKLDDLRQSLEVVRALLTAAWELRFISHHSMAQLGSELDSLGKQATRWRQWFEGTAVGEKAQK